MSIHVATVVRLRGIGILGLLAAGIYGSMAAAQVSPTPPNILLIQADDLGYGDLSAYGQTHFQTPSLDKLAREGMRFTNYYAGTTVCAPSRAALLTGLHTGHTWIRGNGGNATDVPLRDEDVTIGTRLRDAGYRTAVIGKWGLGGPDQGSPARKGFEYSFGFLNQTHAHEQYTDHLFRNSVSVPVSTKDYANDAFTTEAAAFIEKNDPKPFFLYLNYTAPHAELLVPEDSIAPFRGKFPEKPFVNPRADGSGYRSQPAPHAAYAAMITRMDRDIGRLVDLVHARNLDRRTLILFMSDNGPHVEAGGDPAFFNSSGGLRGVKRDMYEGGIRVPMIARWTGTVPAGRTSAFAAAHWDMFPTLAEVAGLRTPSGLDGMSILRTLRGQQQPAHDFLYWEFHEGGFRQAVRMGAWKAVRVAKDKPLELYNLDTDLREEHDVAGQQPAVVAKIEAYLKTARVESARWPVE
ncbi:MAG: arylsulfatase [Acidobacteriota bacterium]